MITFGLCVCLCVYVCVCVRGCVCVCVKLCCCCVSVSLLASLSSFSNRYWLASIFAKLYWDNHVRT